MGRKPIGLDELRRNGSFRADRHARGKLACQAPLMPGDLTGAESAFWKVITGHLVEMGSVAEVDGAALRMLCETLAFRLDAIDLLRDEGLQVKGHRGRCVHPAARLLLQLTDRAERLLRQFGLAGDLSRRGLNIEASHSEIDPDVRRILKLDRLPAAGA